MTLYFHFSALTLKENSWGDLECLKKRVSVRRSGYQDTLAAKAGGYVLFCSFPNPSYIWWSHFRSATAVVDSLSFKFDASVVPPFLHKEEFSEKSPE